MANESPISDNETLYRRVPPGSSWIKENKLTSGNFELKVGERGVSVSRASITTPQQLLGMRENPTGWCVAAITAGEVRALGLDVIPAPTQEDAGHAEIIPATSSLSHAVRRRLAKRFRLLPKD